MIIIAVVVVAIVVANTDVEYGCFPHLTKVDCMQRAGKWLQRENAKYIFWKTTIESMLYLL